MKKEYKQPSPGVYPQLPFENLNDMDKIKSARRIVRKSRSEMTQEDVLARWPSLVAHLICVSLGYCTPGSAANIILDHINNQENWCEWIHSCYNKNPSPAIEMAWKGRHSHKGYMADYKQSLSIVLVELITGKGPVLASWF